VRAPPLHIQSAIERALDYDPVTGDVRWREDRRRAREGDLAGSISRDGAIVIHFMGKIFQATHIAWFLHTGEWPFFYIRVRDKNPLNLQFDNLLSQEQNYIPGSKAQQAREYRARKKAARKLIRPKYAYENVTCGSAGAWHVRSLKEIRVVLISFETRQAAEDYASMYAYGADYVYRNRAETAPPDIAQRTAGGAGALTLQEALNRFAYEPQLGAIFRRKNPRMRIDMAGTLAIELDDVRRPIVRASGRTYTAGMMAWFLHTGDWPKRKQLGYRDGNPQNTKFANLFLKGTENAP
jgi:hypothetical protein